MKGNWSVTLICAASLGTSSAADAQGAIMAGLPDVLGQTIAGAAGSGWPEECLALEDHPTASQIARFESGAQIGINRYLSLAAVRGDLGLAYKRNYSARWQLDGASIDDLSEVNDPWASRVVRLEPVALELGQSLVIGRGVWRAFDAEGQLLGYYDAEMIRRSDDYAIGRLLLWSPGGSSGAKPVTPFCAGLGDHETYLDRRLSTLHGQFNRYDRQANEAERAVAANPSRRSLVEQAQRRRERANAASAEVAQAQIRLDEARTALQAATAVFGSVPSRKGTLDPNLMTTDTATQE